jgi:hypothetical protein
MALLLLMLVGACLLHCCDVAVFAYHEEVPITAVYRDPIHDFGIFKFDPSLVRSPQCISLLTLKVKYMSVPELRLRPENAKVGVDVRVIGWHHLHSLLYTCM